MPFLQGLKIFETIGDLFGAATFIATASGLFKEEGGKITVTDSGRQVAQKIAPSWLGIGQNDEAIHIFGWSQLTFNQRMAWTRNMRALPHNDDRALVILTIAKIPESKDQVTVMQGLAQLNETEFKEAAQAFRLIPQDDAMIRKIKHWIETEGADFARARWVQIQGFYRQLDTRAAVAGRHLNRTVRTFEREQRDERNLRANAGFFGKLFGTNWRF